RHGQAGDQAGAHAAGDGRAAGQQGHGGGGTAVVLQRAQQRVGAIVAAAVVAAGSDADLAGAEQVSLGLGDGAKDFVSRRGAAVGVVNDGVEQVQLVTSIEGVDAAGVGPAPRHLIERYGAVDDVQHADVVDASAHIRLVLGDGAVDDGHMAGVANAAAEADGRVVVDGVAVHRHRARGGVVDARAATAVIAGHGAVSEQQGPLIVDAAAV